jgi:3-oxoadipate enol-lactonase
MPFVQAGDLRMRYELTGPAGASVVVLSHSLGSDLSMWEPQVTALVGAFSVLRYDGRGHGQTTVKPKACTIADLGRDLLRLLDALAIERAHFCGLSIGGLVGMWLAAHAPERIERLVLSNTAARIGTADSWNARIETVRREGMAAIAATVVGRWFTPAFRDLSPEVAAAALRTLAGTPAEGYIACCAAIRDADATGELDLIQSPTLVVSGTSDPATTPADGRLLAERIRGALYVELPASHLSNLEAPDRFNAELTRFLQS